MKSTLPHIPKTRSCFQNGQVLPVTRASLLSFPSLNVYLLFPPRCLSILMLTSSAVAIYKPPDVRPILQAYQGKDIPIEYAKKETEARELHIAEWKGKYKGLSSGGFTMSSLFGMSTEVRVSTSASMPLVLTASSPLTHPSRQHTLNKSAPRHSASTRLIWFILPLTKPSSTRCWRRGDKRWPRRGLVRCSASSIIWPARSRRTKRTARPLRATGMPK